MKWFYSKDGGREEGQNAMPAAQGDGKGATLDPLDPLGDGLNSTTMSRRRMLGLAGGAVAGAALLGATPKPASALIGISQKQNPERFRSPHHLVMPSTGGRTYVHLTGIVLATLQGNSEAQWRQETFRIYLSLEKAAQDAGFPKTHWFRAVHWTAFATLSSIFDREVANNAGWAIRAFRLEDPSILRSAAVLDVDTAVKDTDGYIYRLGYNITMLGTFQPSPPAPG